MPVLTPQDHDFYKENGYVVVKNAVPKANLNAVIDNLFDFLGMDPDDPEDWYRPPLKPGGMIEIYQTQALWDNRQSPRIYEAFSELRGQKNLWVSIDRANFKPPSHPDHPEYDFTGFTHWDADTTRVPLHRNGMQGVLYLSDTAENQGGFQCVPEIYREIDEYLARQPADRNPRVPDLTGYEVKPIPGDAGDLVIWNSLLPHGNGHNASDRPRFAQFISMYVAREENEELRQNRIDQWKNHHPPYTSVFPGDPRKVEEEFGTTAELTPLGRKLLGLDLWED